MTNSDTTLLIEFAEPIFKEFFLNQFDKKKNLNNGFVRELFEHNYPVRTISDVGWRNPLGGKLGKHRNT